MSSDKPPLERLSPRERQVLELYARGQRRADIARALSRSMKTIDCHLVSCQVKFGVDNNHQLLVKVIPLFPQAAT